MSHFTRVATKINDLPALYKALDEMNIRYAVGLDGGEPAFVRGYVGDTVLAKVSIDMGQYDIGVIKSEDGNYELVADWWGVETTTGRTEREIVDEISRAYAKARVVMACEETGYTMSDVEVQEDGSVCLVAESWS